MPSGKWRPTRCSHWVPARGWSSLPAAAVTREENYDHLHRNGTIIRITRDLEKLPTQGRPLSHKDRLAQMLEVRDPMYARFADYTVDNNGDPDETVRNILNIIG